MSTPLSQIGKSGITKSSGIYKEVYGDRQVGHYQYQSSAGFTSGSLTGAGDSARFETTTSPAEFAVTDLGRSADERRIYLISKGMSDVPSYLQWRSTIGKQDFKRRDMGTSYADIANDDVFAYHEWLDNKFGADNFSRQRDGSVVVNAATSTDPAVQEARKAATSRDTGGTEAPAEGSVAAPRRGRRGATLASLESSVNKPSILGG